MLPFDQVLAQEQDEEMKAKYQQYTTRLQLTREEAEMGHILVNGKYAPFDLVSVSWQAVVDNSNGHPSCSRNFRLSYNTCKSNWQ